MTVSEQGKEASAFHTDKAQQGCVETALTNPIPEPLWAVSGSDAQQSTPGLPVPRSQGVTREGRLAPAHRVVPLLVLSITSWVCRAS